MEAKDIVVLDWPLTLDALEKNGARPQNPNDIKKAGEDNKKIDNGWSWGVGTGTGYLKDAIKVHSIADMVNKIRRSLKPGECIKSLAIAGHGSNGNISVGDGQTTQAGQHIDGNRAEWEPQLRRLCDKFCPDIPEIEILLLGCETGVCDRGAAKLFELATFFKECAKGTKGRFCVYGTKRASAQDVEDAIKRKRRDHLVKVCSDADKKPACLVPPTKDGPKKKDKPPKEKRLKKKERKMTPRFPRPNPEDFTAIAFRDLRIVGKSLPVAFLSPQPISVEEYLDLYDFSTAYDPTNIPSEIDGEAILQRADGSTETLNISLDYKGLEYSFRGEGFLYFLQDLDNQTVVRDLVTTSSLKEDC